MHQGTKTTGHKRALSIFCRGGLGGASWGVLCCDLPLPRVNPQKSPLIGTDAYVHCYAKCSCDIKLGWTA